MSKLFIILSLILLVLSSAHAEEYDFIIAGGGTAASVVAARLTENPDVKVLVLERGDDNSAIFSNVVQIWDAPMVGAGANQYLLAQQNYFIDKLYSQEANLGFRSLITFRPILLGGGSSINGNVYSRFSSDDLAAWNNTFWTYNNTLDDWKALESCSGVAGTCDPQYHGTDGPIHTVTVQPNTILQHVMNVMPTIFNVSLNPDVNGPSATGVGIMPRNVQVVGGLPVRQDSWSRVLKPVSSRPNLVIKTGAKVLKIDYSSNGKHYVVYEYQDNIYHQKAKKEVILSMGTYQDPKYLLLSGIGNCTALQALGIDCVINNPEVGKNLQDSVLSSAIYIAPFNVSAGSPGSIVVAYYKSPQFTGEGTDMEVAIASLSPYSNVYLIQLTQLRHNAVGQLKLESSNPNMEPQFSFNMYSTDADVDPMVDQFKKVRLMMAASGVPFFEQSPGYALLPPTATDTQIREYFKSTANVEWHTIGTCGINRVVDGRLRLIDSNGNVVPGIRVISNSVIPTRGRTHSTSSGAMLIGQVGSRFIKEDWNL